MNTIPNQIDALDNVNLSLSLVNLLRSTSAEMIVELSGEAGLQAVLELVADKLEGVKVHMESNRGRAR